MSLHCLHKRHEWRIWYLTNFQQILESLWSAAQHSEGSNWKTDSPPSPRPPSGAAGRMWGHWRQHTYSLFTRVQLLYKSVLLVAPGLTLLLMYNIYCVRRTSFDTADKRGENTVYRGRGSRKKKKSVSWWQDTKETKPKLKRTRQSLSDRKESRRKEIKWRLGSIDEMW